MENKRLNQVSRNNELELAWNIIERTGANLFLTGKAGTGKTTFLKELVKHSSKRMVVLAPTGIAAINAGGVTIHSFFQLPLSPYIPGTTFDRSETNKYFRFSKVKRNIIRTMDLLVIDEISMVRTDLLDAIDSVMRRYRNHGKPFGGAQLLMIGDLQQLSPVIKDDEWSLLSKVYDTPYFFSSKALNASEYHTVELKEVYRQQDMSFVALLNQIRENRATAETLEMLNKRYIPDFKPDRNSDFIRITTHNHPAQMINEQELNLLPTREYSFKAEVEGTFPETSYPADERLVLKEGAQVMFIKNDPEKRFYNGMIGEVVFVDDREITVRCKSGGGAFKLEKAEWTNSKYTLDDVSKEIKETVEGVFRQYPLRLAWAITVHKSQGLTFEHAIIDVSHSFAHGQTYVALSRCKTLEGLVLSAPLRSEAIISDGTLDEYLSNVSSKTPSAETLSDLQRAYTIQLLDELFDFTELQTSFNLLLRTLDEHFYRRYPKMLAEYKRLAACFGGLIDVSVKFKNQYSRLINDGAGADNTLLQERVHKACAYFAENIRPLVELCKKTKVDTENKALKKQFDDRYSTFESVLMLKNKLFEYESKLETSFSAGDYLQMKARTLLGLDGEEPERPRKRKTTKVKEPKQPKPNTRQVSFDMFTSGMSLAQIAAERSLTRDTIFNHLAYYVKAGQLEIDKLIPQEHLREIRLCIIEHPEFNTIGEIKSAVSQDITYGEIRMIMG